MSLASRSSRNAKFLSRMHGYSPSIYASILWSIWGIPQLMLALSSTSPCLIFNSGKNIGSLIAAQNVKSSCCSLAFARHMTQTERNNSIVTSQTSLIPPQLPKPRRTRFRRGQNNPNPFLSLFKNQKAHVKNVYDVHDACNDGKGDESSKTFQRWTFQYMLRHCPRQQCHSSRILVRLS